MTFWLLNDTYFLYAYACSICSVYHSQTGYLNLVHLSYIEITVLTTKNYVQKKAIYCNLILQVEAKAKEKSLENLNAVEHGKSPQ